MRVGRRSARGGVGGADCQPGGWPSRRVSRQAERSAARSCHVRRSMWKSSSAAPMLRPYVMGGAP
eukprot:5202802-Prymnesium_polylepis.1